MGYRSPYDSEWHRMRPATSGQSHGQRARTQLPERHGFAGRVQQLRRTFVKRQGDAPACSFTPPSRRPTLTFTSGPTPSPTCLGTGCGKLCDSSSPFCFGRSNPFNPDFLDPQNPDTPQNPSHPDYPTQTITSTTTVPTTTVTKTET